ncbi:MAG: hypothetical protein ABIS67_11730 [Candidatus Eisenbacteria bacterium]
MNLDWSRLRAVVIESDDWGLCAWVPDVQARLVLGDTSSFRGPAGRRYGGSTLESAADVRQLYDTLTAFQGADGFRPVWQANTIVSSPNYAAMRPPLFEMDALPLVNLPATPSRWTRPGMWEEVRRACASGLWWPELHGLHHLPEAAWLAALRLGAADARRAFEQQSPVCVAVEAGSEYDPAEPPLVRDRNLTLATECFTHLFGRPPASLCPPDYRWDDRLETQAERLGIAAIQGKSEQHGARMPRLRRLWHRHRWPRFGGRKLYLPPRIAFEPRAGDARTGVAAAHRAVLQAWRRGQPAVLSTHRVNYAHLDADASAAGCAALRDLLQRLCADRAVFLTDSEVTQLVTGGWSRRDLGERGMLLRYHGVPGEAIRFAVPSGVRGARFAETRDDGARIEVTGGQAEVRVNVGEHRIEWSRA